MIETRVGIVGYGLYLPELRMTAEQISEASGGIWSADAVRQKLGFDEKPVPGPEDGTQEMGARAALDALRRTGTDPLSIDLILCVGEEWKEYPLTTSGIYIQERIGAKNAWSIDIQQRCNTTVAALRIAKHLLIADDTLNTVLIVGGYRNGDLIDYRDPAVSFMFNLAAGAGALIIKKNHDRNLILGSHIITDGSMARDAGAAYGGIAQPIEFLPEAELAKVRKHGNRSLRVFDVEHMKTRLEEVSMKNWMSCIDRALSASGKTRKDIGYLNALHFKPSMFNQMLSDLGLQPSQSVYLRKYGHLGQVDQMLSIHEGLREGRLKDGDLMVMVAAGIGYVWGALVVAWGPVDGAKIGGSA